MGFVRSLGCAKAQRQEVQFADRGPLSVLLHKGTETLARSVVRVAWELLNVDNHFAGLCMAKTLCIQFFLDIPSGCRLCAGLVVAVINLSSLGVGLSRNILQRPVCVWLHE